MQVIINAQPLAVISWGDREEGAHHQCHADSCAQQTDGDWGAY